MRKNPRLFRLTAGVAMAALLGDTVVSPPAFAQPAPPPLPQPYRPQPYRPLANQTQADPPARVGRIARTDGTVSFHNDGDTQWSPASVNFPVSTGNAFWTEPSATAELEISDSRIVLAGATEFDITSLDGNGLQAVAAQGEAYFHLRDPLPDEIWSVQTPRGRVRLGSAGRYAIVVGSTEQPTLVTVLEGSAEVEGPGLAMHLTSGQTATISGSDDFQGAIGPALRDPFVTARLDAERPRPAPSAPIPNQVAAMPGGSDLGGYGNWAPTPEYGPVWYPPVSPDWVPYREGHWAYVAPWGWTWIDDAPWGFAPFHYGRWVQLTGRWCWTPGSRGAPVYAPALVAFIGLGAGVALGAAIAHSSVGWIPLGPHEAYHPWYRASDRHVRAVNISHVTTINNTVAINTYVNQRAATSIPGSEMAASHPVRPVAQPVTPQQLASARPIVGQQAIRPTAVTSGVTQGVVRQLNLGPTASLHPAPGPAVRRNPAVAGFARPDPGSPPFQAVGGSPPIRPSGLIQIPATAPPSARAADGPTPQAVRPLPPPVISRPIEPSFARPGALGPVVTPRPIPHMEPRPLPQVITPSGPQPPLLAKPAPAARLEPQHFAPPGVMQRVEPQHFAPPVAMPRVEPRHFPTPVPMQRVEPPRFVPPVAMPRVEPQHFAPPVAMPRVEPQHFPTPVPMHRAEPPHFAPPAPRPDAPRPATPAVRDKRPGER